MKKTLLFTTVLICFAAVLACCAPPDNSSLPSGEPSSETGASSETTSSETASSEITSSLPDSKYALTEGFKEENLSRYEAYAEKHKNLTDEETVRLVNYNFDIKFYTEIKTSPNLHSKYVLVNKWYALPADYVPQNLVKLTAEYGNTRMSLVKEAYDAFIELVDAAKADGYGLYGQSAYRDYAMQEALYNKYLKNEGGNVAAVDLYSARPGHSEHQTGYAIDVLNKKGGSMGGFGKTESYLWLKEHCHEYGWVIHYTKENKFITGYDTEEWHIRYVGVTAATEIKERGITIDEYLMEYTSRNS